MVEGRNQITLFNGEELPRGVWEVSADEKLGLDWSTTVRNG